MWSYLLYCWTLLHNKLSVVPKFLHNSSYQGDAEMLLATSCYRKCYNINSSSYEPFGSKASSSTTLKTHQQIGTPTLQAESPSIDQRRAESPYPRVYLLKMTVYMWTAIHFLNPHQKSLALPAFVNPGVDQTSDTTSHFHLAPNCPPPPSPNHPSPTPGRSVLSLKSSLAALDKG